MKSLLSVLASVLVLFSCQSPQQADEVKTDTAVATVTETAPAAEAPYDPDPTDTIPGDRYIADGMSKETADLVRLTLQDRLKADLEKNLLDSNARKFFFHEIDLNDDGKKEIFVGLTGPYFCGSGGCSPYLLDNQGNVITHFSVADYPIIIENNKTNGYKDLVVYSGGKNRTVKFDGKKYPSNPSMQPALKIPPADGLPRILDMQKASYPWFRF